MAWWLAFVFQIQVNSCCVFSEKKKKKKWKMTNVNSIFCIFDCIIKQKDCVFMYVVAIEDRHCLELLSFTHPYLHLRWSVQDSFLYIYESIFKYIDFIFHPSCAICCVELSFIVSNHAINKETTLLLKTQRNGGVSCQLTCVHLLPVRLLI